MEIETFVLNNGLQMPVLGLGTWQSTPDQVKDAVRSALDNGYRHIDTAWNYKNEAAIGEVLQEYFKNGKLTRNDVFITTKLPMIHMDPQRVKASLEESLKSLQLQFIDLYLIHAPISLKDKGDGSIFPVDENGKLMIAHHDLVQVWKLLEELVDEGKTKSIGVSNFNSEQIERIVKNARIKPVTNQVECHIYLQQKELQKFCEERGIKLTSYATLGSPGRPGFLMAEGDHANALEDPVTCQIAKKHKKTPAQVLLRNMIQRGIFVIPKSVTPARIVENSQIFDFQLTNEDMKAMASLDEKKRLFSLKMLEEHPEFPYGIPY
ncbi:hypothetical protein CHS0354_020527 [Potamilus streckersoni]|uniref:NADP-dependent oxidoreductase domain-containing protein n=1 Tax=Potamilus streckersoni TaxID=2493646 RepID=A0AAE0SQJ9_9BIVA|nr:hypothetical protein CHS0354_020527 [Potamilus streckersoni]